jgi:predicted transcriptional regulator of viral defense system
LPPQEVIAAKLGWASPNRSQEVMRILEERGWIERNAVGKYRFKRVQEAALAGVDWPPRLQESA